MNTKESKNMNWWMRFGCALTGWSPTVLDNCTEASKAHLTKYTSALLILMLIWSVTGFCFAQRYVGLPVWGCVLVSLAFVTIVLMIERQIILTSQKSVWVVVFRVLIAILMAIIGATIFDQMIFGKDIDKQMAQTIETQVADLTQKRASIIDGKLQAVTSEKDSLNKVNAALQADINANPWIVQRSATNSQQKLVVNGQIKTVNTPSVTTNQVPNPKQDVVKANDEKIKQLSEQEKDWTKKKQSLEEDTRKECRENVGLLEELDAMLAILTNRVMAKIFYFIFFFLLVFMELFVVVSRFLDKECDYDVAIKGSGEARVIQLKNAFRKVEEKRQ